MPEQHRWRRNCGVRAPGPTPRPRGSETTSMLSMPATPGIVGPVLRWRHHSISDAHTHQVHIRNSSSCPDRFDDRCATRATHQSRCCSTSHAGDDHDERRTGGQTAAADPAADRSSTGKREVLKRVLHHRPMSSYVNVVDRSITAVSADCNVEAKGGLPVGLGGHSRSQQHRDAGQVRGSTSSRGCATLIHSLSCATGHSRRSASSKHLLRNATPPTHTNTAPAISVSLAGTLIARPGMSSNSASAKIQPDFKAETDRRSGG